MTTAHNSGISDLNSSLGNRIGELNAHCAEADTHRADAGQKIPEGVCQGDFLSISTVMVCPVHCICTEAASV
jgi:hypothetical protein